MQLCMQQWAKAKSRRRLKSKNRQVYLTKSESEEREKHFVVGGNTHPGITNTRRRRESKIKYKDFFTFFP